MQNYCQKIEIRKTTTGRGIFAASEINKGDILVVEKSICAVGSEHPDLSFDIGIDKSIVKTGKFVELSKKCMELINLKGQHAVRLSYLYNGTNKKLKVPKVDVFTKNNYKGYQLKDISMSQVDQIVSLNCQVDKRVGLIFPLISFFNHNEKSCLEQVMYGPNQEVKFIIAKENITPGTELFIEKIGVDEKKTENTKREKEEYNHQF